MEVEIVDIHGSSILRFEPNAGSRRVRHLMGDDYVSLKVSSPTRIPLTIGCIAKTQYGNFEIASPSPNPTYNEDTGGYDYDIRFDAHYIKWKNKIFLYTQGDRRSEAAWSLTAPLEVHMEIFLKNLKKLGYTYGGTHYGFSIASSIENKSRLITYQSTSLLDALNEMAKAWDCEWWLEDNMIMFGRVQYGSYVDIEIGVNAANIQPSAQRDSFATRIYAFGSTRNIPPGYRESQEEEVVVNGIVQKRLMLPSGYPYVDVRSGLNTAEAIEGVVFADHIYPRTDGLISEVSAYDVIVNDDEEGKTESDSEPAQDAGNGEASDQPNQEEGEGKKKQRYWRFKDANFNFSNDYILPNTELRVVFQSGKLNGMDFAVAFNPNGKPEKLEDGTWNPDAQLFEIVANEDYGRLLPDDILKPEAGDKYVLYGWDVTKIENLGLVAEAESELLDYARSYVAKMSIDPNTYTCPMMSDYMYGLDKHGNLNSAYSKHFDIGASVNLVNAAFFSGGSRQSRVVGYEMDFSEPWVCTLYVGEKASYSRLKNLESKVDALTLKGQTYTGSRGGGGGIYVIGTNDTTPPTDRNVYSSLRQRRMFLKRDADDRTAGKLASDKAFEVGEFRSGASGAMLFKDALSGHTVLELDKLYVRLKAYFETLEIVHVNSVGGKQIITPGGGIRLNRVATKGLVEVEVEKTRPKVDAEGNPVLDEEGNPVMETYTETQLVDNGVPEGVYRCWFLAEQDGEKVKNRFAVGDQAYSKTFNAKEGVSNKVSNSYYWRLVTCVGDDYIDLSMTDCDTGSDTPVAGDVVAHLGNRNDADRQNALVFSAVDTFSPSITLYQGINSYSYVGKDVVGYGVDKTTGKAFFRVYGDGYIGARDGSSFLQFIEGEGAQFKGKLSVGTTIGDGSTIESALQKATQSAIDTANENIGTFVTAVTAKLDGLGKQIDRQIQTWFDTGTPTLNNHPAENWTTDEERNVHLGDLYYDDNGYAYRFQQKPDGTYYWKEIKDNDIVKALADAAKAQDTADGKRRVFVSQPTDADEYDVGDLWVNANYPADASVYSNEILRSVSHKAANAPFTINHWTKSSKYTDDTRAEQVQQNVDNLATEVNAVHSTVNDMHDFTDEAFKDGIVDRAEAAKIEGYINSVQSIKAQADNAYAPVYENALLAGVAKTELAEAMMAFTQSCTELITTVNTSVADGIVTAIERAAVDGKYTAFNTKYGDFTARLAAANAYIQDKINSTANDALSQIGSYSYLKNALKENTSIEGGLIQSSVLALGYTDAQGAHHIMAGSSGIYESSQLGGGIAFWAGGSRIDKFVNTTATDAASFVVRHDGSGYAAKGAIRFNADGTVEADPLSFFVGESTVGGLLASLQVVMAGNKPDYIIPKVPFQSLTVADGIRIGDGWLKYDATNNAVYVEGLDGGTIGFYSKGWLSFRGANDGSGGSAVAGAANLADLKDVSLGSLVAGQALVWNGAKWVNSTIATSGLDEASLSNYLSSHGYATQQWVNGAFVNKAGDTMTGHLTMFAKDTYLKNSTDNSQYLCYGFKNTANAIIAQIGYHNTAKRIIIHPVGSSEPWVDAVGKYNLIVGNNELKYNTYTLWHSGNDGHNSGLDADLLDGVHCSDMLHFVALYPQNLDANGIVTTGSCYVPRGDMNNSSWNGYTFTNFPTSKPQGGFMLMNLAEGNYRRQIYTAYNNPNLYVRYYYFNGTIVTWSPWRTLAFTDSTVANANSLGGIAAGDYVTRISDQTISGVKTFTTYVKHTMPVMFKPDGITDGLYLSPNNAGGININAHKSWSYTASVAQITNAGGFIGSSFVKSGGTAAQFLKADGSVDSRAFLVLDGQQESTGASLDLNAFNTAVFTRIRTGEQTTTNCPFAGYGQLLNLWTTGKVSALQIVSKSSDIYFRSKDGASATITSNWHRILHSDNYSSILDDRYVNASGDTMTGPLAVREIDAPDGNGLLAYSGSWTGVDFSSQYGVGTINRQGVIRSGNASLIHYRHGAGNATIWDSLNDGHGSGLEADLLDGYHVSQLARLTAANASAGAYNLPVYVNGGVVNAVSSVGEAFLSWGGQSLTGNFSPVDGAMMSHLGANRFAFLKPAGTTFQYSTNGGATWSDYGLSNTQKSGFFDAGVQQALQAGKAANGTATASHQLRITIATSAAGVYTDINKFAINFATQGCSGTTVTIEKALESTPDSWVTVASNVPLAGWTAWNVVNVPAFRTYGNSPGVQYGRIRFTFKCTGVSSDKSPFVVLCIMAYGGFGWTTPSYMAATGHLYKYDGNQNAYFPGYVRLNNNGHDVGTTWNNGAGQLGIALVNNANQTPLLVVHRYGVASDVTGANRLFALELLNSGAEMHFAFGGSTKFSMTNTGVFFADGGLWTNGFLSFKGKNTSSDARLKRYIGDIRVPLAVIAKAPNIIYAWRDDGSLDMGSIAQYWQRYLPLSVRLCQNGYLGMDYSKVALACVISMASELLGVKDDVSTLKQEVRQLRHENRELKQQIDKMERRIA